MLKAVEKEQTRRYQSAERLADDRRRDLEGEPILARRPSGIYLLRKRLRKHRVWVALTAAAVALALGGLLHEARSRQREWAGARAAALALQKSVEAGGEVGEKAGTLKDRHPQLPEAQLIFAHAAYRQELPSGSAIPFLEAALEGDPSLWVGRAEEALEDYRQARIRVGWPLYYDARAFLILRELGRPREAEELLNAARRDVKDDWLAQIFSCLAGELTPGKLVADAVSRDNLEQLCEAYYYAGEACLLSERPAEAREWFEQCVRTGLVFDPDTPQLGTPMNEYELAQWRLDSLFADKSSPSPP